MQLKTFLAVEQLYASSEAHALSDSQGDFSHFGMFSDNSDKNIFEFFYELEMSLMGWVTNGQRAHLLRKFLSEETKTKVDKVSDSYSKINGHLITDYGGAVISW